MRDAGASHVPGSGAEPTGWADGAPLAAVRAVPVVRLGYDFEPVLENYLFAHATLTTTS
jgi:hypothetical protein